MSNIISFDAKNASFCLSNGGMDMLINILALSGSALARTESEKRLIISLSEKDQAMLGRGCVDFDITELPWQRETFEADKAFLRQVIRGAGAQTGWDKLDYRPNEEFVSVYLDSLENLIDQMTSDDIKEESLREWLSEAEKDDPVFRSFPRCKKHGTFLTCFGCQICNS
ncbi:MAG: hypothetical protein K2O18_00995 [Oscillospiraceae bacterium]|nr:hypothetical protein [Oscillospiraceae bacterium]